MPKGTIVEFFSMSLHKFQEISPSKFIGIRPFLSYVNPAGGVCVYKFVERNEQG